MLSSDSRFGFLFSSPSPPFPPSSSLGRLNEEEARLDMVRKARERVGLKMWVERERRGKGRAIQRRR